MTVVFYPQVTLVLKQHSIIMYDFDVTLASDQLVFLSTFQHFVLLS